MCICMCVCLCVGHCDRCWIAIVMAFNAYRAALPGNNCNVREALNGQAGKLVETLNHNKSNGGRTVTGAHGSVMGNKQSVTGAWDCKE